MPQKIDLVGRRFGRLTVLEECLKRAAKRIRWVCRCDCGAVVTVLGYALSCGNTKSCGCHRREVATDKSTTHGGTATDTYSVWESMKKRCLSRNSKSYPRYGGRGISICDRWLQFENFLEDMGPRPDGMSIDRIDNGKGYEPGNCRWATSTEQQRNRTNNRILTLNGVSKTQSQWAEESGLADATICGRLKRGWSLERALTEGAHT